MRLHSKYNPHKEAEMFASTVKGNPSIIVITEPGESYLAECLRKKFPCAVLIAIRYTDTLFIDSDKQWNVVWRPSYGNLPFFLVNYIPDEHLVNTIFLPWKAADVIFPSQAKKIQEKILKSINIIKSIAYTRSFFGKRWLQNSIKNIIFVEHAAKPIFGTQDILLAGAGPSLQNLKRHYVANMTIACVGSAYNALLAKNIVPDFCISTDAGYWALRHFDMLNPHIPVIFPLEAAIPSSVTEKNPCIMLTYGSALETELFSNAGYKPLKGKENGTVMGTAVEFLLTASKNTVFITGLDLAASNGFSHAQPHSGTLLAVQTENRTNPLTEMLAIQNFNAQSLETYRQWFLQLPVALTDRIYRVGTQGATIPNLKTLDACADLLQNTLCGTPITIQNHNITDKADRRKTTATLLASYMKTAKDVIKTNPNALSRKEYAAVRHIIALCAYPRYCALMKNPAATEIRHQAAEETTAVLSALIKQVNAYEL